MKIGSTVKVTNTHISFLQETVGMCGKIVGSELCAYLVEFPQEVAGLTTWVYPPRQLEEVHSDVTEENRRRNSMATFLQLHVPDNHHGIGIEFVSDTRDDAKNFLNFMWSQQAEIDGKSPFWQGSASNHDWNQADFTVWEFFEYFHCDPQDERVIDVLFEAAAACNLPVK